jgi:putative peptidoglycan lipid II flippase
VAVNGITCLGLLLALQGRLGDLPLRAWCRDTVMLTGAAIVSGLVAWALAVSIAWPNGLWGRLLECSLAGAASLLVYAAVASAARVPEMDQLLRQLRGQLMAKLPGLG